MTAGSVSPSIARVRFIDLGGLAGGLVGLGLYATAADDSLGLQPTLWSLNLGTAAGLGLAWLLTTNMEPDRGADSESDDARTPTLWQALLRARPMLLPVENGGQLGMVGTW